MRRMPVIEHTIRDLRFAIRHFTRTPLVATTMILVFALGIGFSTALFMFIRSFVDGPVPGIARQESLVRIRGIDRSNPGRGIGREFSYPEYRQYAAETTLFSDVMAWTSWDAVLDVGAREPDIQSGAATYVTANYFKVLGIRPRLGAGLPVDSPDSAVAPPLVAVISYVLWDRRFQRAPDVIGRTMKVNGVPVTIVGVAPRRFAGARTGGSHMRVWLPLSTRSQIQHAAFSLESYDDARFGLGARLQPGIRAEDVRPAVETIAARTAQQTTPGRSTASADVATMLAGNYFPPSGETSAPGIGRFIALLVPLTVLLITCTNVSALLAGLGVARRREIAVRLAMGASRGRVVRQLVTESALLAIVAGAVSLFAILVLLRLFDAGIPDLQIEIDWRAIALAFGLAMVAGIVFGISPALHATRLALSEVMKDSAGVGAAGGLRLQSWLVVAQIALTQPALLGMGALLLDLRSDLQDLPSRAFAEHIVDVRFNTNPRYGAMDQEREVTLQRLLSRLAAVPGVAAIAAQDDGDWFTVEPHPADRAGGVEGTAPVEVRAIAAPAGYFGVMDVAFVRGRDFGPADRISDSALVIGRDLARRLWGDADPVGRRVIASGGPYRGTRTFDVIGVVDEASAGSRGSRRENDARVFVPRLRTISHFLIRTHAPSEPLLPAIRAAAVDEAPALPIVSVGTLAAVEASERRSIVGNISAAGGTGALALLLSAIGLYAVVAFAVGQRKREIGIRTALGADSRQVVGLFVRRGLRLCLTGLVIGLALGIGGVRVIAAAEGQPPPDGMLILAALVACVVTGVALLATWIPATRAARIDPLEALRVE